MANKKFRRFQLTINDKQEEMEYKEIMELTKALENVRYFAMSKERGEEEKSLHFHIYLELEKAKYWTAIQKYYMFYKPHIETVDGTSKQNRDYIFAEGKHEENKKDLLEQVDEFGVMATDTQGDRTDIDLVIEMLEDGAKPIDVMREYPKPYFMHQNKIEKYFQKLLYAKYMREYRDIEVFYVHGESGTGKTSGIYNKEGLENVYRVSNYEHPFDGYTTEEAIVLEEFHSSLQFGYLLQLTEKYPLSLKARYGDKVACFKRVYIVSNATWKQQYTTLQVEKPNVYKAMDRRIDGYIEVNEFGDFENYFSRKDMTSKELAEDIFGKDIVREVKYEQKS